MKKAVLFLSLCFALFVVHLNAQNDFKKGYLVFQGGDTIYGEIREMGDGSMSRICTFRQNSVLENYVPEDISAYRIEGGKYFVVKEIDGQRCFLEFLVNGRLNIYYQRKDSEDCYYIERSDMSLKMLPFKEGMVKKKDVLGVLREYRFITTDHQDILEAYTNNVPDLEGMKAEIRKNKRLSHKGLINLAQKYHDQVCEDDLCIIYKQKPEIKLRLEPVVGFTNYGKYANNKDAFYYGGEILKNTTYPVFGILGRLWLPRLGDNLYLKGGMLLSFVQTVSFHQGEKDGMHVRIPLYLEYFWNNDGLIQPSFGIGLNGQRLKGDTDVTVGAVAGINVRLTKSLALMLNYDVDFQFRVPPKRLYTHTFYAGIGITL